MALDYRWRLRELMAARGIFTAGELGPHLAAHGVRLSDSQVWRLVTGRPERLNLRVLVVLCAILDCTPDDLIERIEVEQPEEARGDRPCGEHGCRAQARADPSTGRWLKPRRRRRCVCAVSVGACGGSSAPPSTVTRTCARRAGSATGAAGESADAAAS